MDVQTDLLDEDLIKPRHRSRIKLIPLWMKIFAWIFIVFGCISPVAIVYGLLGNDFELSLYGLETTEPITAFGIGIIFLFILKGLVAIGLLTEKNWAVKLGMADALIGIAACIFTMVYPMLTHGGLSLRLELVALVPYLIKLDKVRKPWESIQPII